LKITGIHIDQVLAVVNKTNVAKYRRTRMITGFPEKSASMAAAISVCWARAHRREFRGIAPTVLGKQAFFGVSDRRDFGGSTISLKSRTICFGAGAGAATGI